MKTSAKRKAAEPVEGAGVPLKEVRQNLAGQRLGQKGYETRERIINAMQCLLDGDDPAPVTLSAIAREAGVGMSTLYLYFPDLAELLLAVLRRVIGMNTPLIERLRARWPDDSLREHSLAFVQDFFDFWQRHARLLQMRNSFADAREERLITYRRESYVPLFTYLARQMDPVPDESACFDYATVLLTGLERVATIMINPDFAQLTQITDEQQRIDYINRLAHAQGRLIEIALRDGRDQSAAAQRETQGKTP